MTNSEKAREYAAEKFKVNPESKKWNITTTYMSACEWKDKQFKEYLKKKIHTIESMKDIDTVLPTDAAVVRTIKEIINELFGE